MEMKCDEVGMSMKVFCEDCSEDAKQREHCTEVGNDVKRWGMISEGFLKESIKGERYA